MVLGRVDGRRTRLFSRSIEALIGVTRENLAQELVSAVKARRGCSSVAKASLTPRQTEGRLRASDALAATRALHAENERVVHAVTDKNVRSLRAATTIVRIHWETG